MFIIEFNSQQDSATIISYASIPTSDSQISQADILTSIYASTSESSDPGLMDSLKHSQPSSTATMTTLKNQSTPI